MIALVVMLTQTANAESVTYNLDPIHTNVTWHANHFGFSTPSGKFSKTEGIILLNEKKPEKSSVKVKIYTESISTGFVQFDEHLKGPDFFNVAKFPEAEFVSDKVELKGKNKAKVHGYLTLLGIKKHVVLNVKLNKISEHPFTKKRTAGFSIIGYIKRSDFGMSYGIPSVADNIELRIETEASIA